MRRFTFVIGALFLTAFATGALAQEGARDTTGEVTKGNATIVFERGGANLHHQALSAFSDIARANPDMAKELARKPSLVADDSFVSKYPTLQQFLKQYPNARDEIASNPGDWLAPTEGSSFQHAPADLKPYVR